MTRSLILPAVLATPLSVHRGWAANPVRIGCVDTGTTTRGVSAEALALAKAAKL
jgi:hypothetical protein